MNTEPTPTLVAVDQPRLVRFRELLEMEISEQLAIADTLEKDGFSDIAERRRERVAGVSFARDWFCEEIPEANAKAEPPRTNE